MSRASIILILILLIIVGGIIFLSSGKHEVAQTRVEKAMLNDNAAK